MRLGKLRKLESYDYHSLPIFLYNSIFQKEDEEMLDVSIINEEKYQKYIKDFPQENDFALARELNGRLSAIIWSRLFKKEDESFGFVDEETPEITLPVLAGYDEFQIGKEILEILCNELKILGYFQVSTSIDNDNPIVDMFVSLGFKEYSSDEENSRKTYIKEL